MNSTMACEAEFIASQEGSSTKVFLTRSTTEAQLLGSHKTNCARASRRWPGNAIQIYALVDRRSSQPSRHMHSCHMTHVSQKSSKRTHHDKSSYTITCEQWVTYELRDQTFMPLKAKNDQGSGQRCCRTVSAHLCCCLAIWHNR